MRSAPTRRLPDSATILGAIAARSNADPTRHWVRSLTFRGTTVLVADYLAATGPREE